MSGRPKVPTTGCPAYCRCTCCQRGSAFTRAATTHDSRLGPADNGLVALLVEVLQQSGQRPGHTIDLGQEVFCAVTLPVSALLSPPAASDAPVMIATRSFRLFWSCVGYGTGRRAGSTETDKSAMGREVAGRSGGGGVMLGKGKCLRGQGRTCSWLYNNPNASPRCADRPANQAACSSAKRPPSLARPTISADGRPGRVPSLAPLAIRAGIAAQI